MNGRTPGEAQSDHAPVAIKVIGQSAFAHAGVTVFTSREIQSVNVKEEPSSPDVEVCPVLEGGVTPVDTPLSPTTFINSILQDSEPTQPTPNTSTANPAPGNGVGEPLLHLWS